MLSHQTIQPDTLELLKELQRQPQLQGYRLVGGTSLALQYGHRISVDLDLFGTQPFDMEEMEQSLQQLGPTRILNKTNNILQTLIGGVKVDIVNYSCYQWIDEPLQDEGLLLATPKDIAALKINAIEGHGSKKDFIDIYVLLQHYTLDEILSFYAAKYPNHSLFRALLSLAYFADAEAQAMPTMLIPTTWEEMKSAITAAVSQYQR